MTDRKSVFNMKTGPLFENCRNVKRGSYAGNAIAVFTSGGDSQGMNAALRAVVRFSLFIGCKVYFIREGYQGMVDGGKYIEEATWSSVSHIIHMGGTVIGSARSVEFLEKPGRLKAARNLVENGISNLVVIGGDGSLTGANLFRHEWPDHLDELLAKGDITKEQRDKHAHLHIVGLVGSIDNDFCGTDLTIGTDTALHRIMEVIDGISCSAPALKRTFIIEVMGRHCGYLALVTANCSEADFVFIPEFPPPENWQEILCSKLVEERSQGKRINIIVMSEGALDRNGDLITAEMVRTAVSDRMDAEARITVLGHFQRGGFPSAFDRVLGCRLGCEAVMSLMESTSESQPCVVTLNGNQVVRIPLVDCVEMTKAVAQAMKEKKWEEAVKLRGATFECNFDTYRMMARRKPPRQRFSIDGVLNPGYTIAVVMVGKPACGINATVRAIVRNFVCPGSTIYGIRDGMDGMADGMFEVLEWESVVGWTDQAGALLGMKATLPKKKMPEIARRLEEFAIQGLIIIGSFEAYQAGLQLTENRGKYPQFCIPIIVVPASTYNNIPGTDLSLGCDTAVNEIMEICDRIRQASQGIRRHVYITETMGGYCGYLATMGGLVSGSDAAYIHEEPFGVLEIRQDTINMVGKMKAGIERGLLLKSNMASKNYNTEFVERVYVEEAAGEFTVSVNVIGQMQQGGTPSPYDRNNGIKLGVRCVEYMVKQLCEHCKDNKVNVTAPESAVLVGLIKHYWTFTPLAELKPQTNFELRIPKEQWWMDVRPIARILSKHTTAYEHLDDVDQHDWMFYASETKVETI